MSVKVTREMTLFRLECQWWMFLFSFAFRHTLASRGGMSRGELSLDSGYPLPR